MSTVLPILATFAMAAALLPAVPQSAPQTPTARARAILLQGLTSSALPCCSRVTGLVPEEIHTETGLGGTSRSAACDSESNRGCSIVCFR
jgi:hypothetical protein